MKHNASYNFISQNVLKATLCTSVANILIYFEEMKLKADFIFAHIYFLPQVRHTKSLFKNRFLCHVERSEAESKHLTSST